MITGEHQPGNFDDANALDSLARVFQSSGILETLNLSDNNLQLGSGSKNKYGLGSLWENWSGHTNMRQLILDYVAMDDASLEALAANLTFADSLEELYVVLTNQVGPKGLEAANQILSSCSKVSSLRWAVRDAPPDAMLPWQGLAQMAENCSQRSVGCSKLKHLVMDGGTLSDSERRDLCNAFKHFTHLKSVKLRSIGLKDEGAKRLAESLLTAKPPLDALDLSRNDIKTNGAAAIARISGVDCIVKNLSVLAMDRNRIDAGGARTILEAFGSKANPKLDIRLDGNPFHYGKVAFNLACRKAQAEAARKELLSDVERMQSEMLDTSTGNRGSNSSEMRMLRDEVNKLKEEKKVLMSAISIMGVPNHAENQARLIERVGNLEKKTFGSIQDSRGESREKYRGESRGERRGESRGDSRGDSRSVCQRRRSSISSESSVSNRTALRVSMSLPENDILSTASGSPQQSIGGRSAISSSTPRHSLSPITSASLVAPPSPKRTMRDNMRDLNSPLSHHTSGNSLARGFSERWGTSSPCKSEASISSSTNRQHRYASPSKSRDVEDFYSAAKPSTQSRRAAIDLTMNDRESNESRGDLQYVPVVYSSNEMG